MNGAALHEARHDKESTYPELVDGPRCRLVVLGLETGGRWSVEAVDFLKSLAAARARDAPKYIQKSAELGWFKRWSIAVAASKAYAKSLLDSKAPLREYAGVDGNAPVLSELIAFRADHPACSRLPLRG